MISLTNLSKTYQDSKVAVLENFNFEIQEGEFITFIGPNGCGKSTLLRILGGLESYRGSFVCKNSSPRISMIFQNYRDTLLPWLSVERNLRFVLTPSDDSTSPEKIMKKLNLWEHRRKYVYQLSGGLQQKLSLARAFLIEPDLLLLDEPFSALDFKTVRSLEEDLSQLQEERKVTTVFISHDPEEAIFLGDKVVVLTGTPLRIKRIISVNLPRPRKKELLQSPEFLKLREEVLELLR